MQKLLIWCFLYLGLITTTTAQKGFKACVKVDFLVQLHYDSISELERGKFLNLHSTSKSFNTEELAYLEKLDVGFGRSFSAPALGTASAKGLPTVEEHLEKIKTHRTNTLKWDKTPPKHKRGMVVTTHPTHHQNLYGFHWKGENADYTPEAEYAVRELKHFYGKDALGDIPLPLYYEPLNEPYVHTKDIKEASFEQVSIEMARLHKTLATAVHKEFPGVLVGGFASAWPSFELKDFKHWNTRMKMFIDQAGEGLDYLSFHIYDGKNVTGGDTFRTGSNSEALFNIIENYTAIKWGQPKPILLSEHGMTRPDWKGSAYTTERDWKIIRSNNHQVMQFMQKPHLILKGIPFITGKATWFKNKEGHSYPWVSMRKVNGKYEWTHLIKLYEFWQGVEGKYVDIRVSDPDILANAFVHEKKGYLALSNLEHGSSTLQLESIVDGKIKSLKIRRLYAKNGVPTLEVTDASVHLKEVTLSADEAVILEYTFKRKQKQSSHVRLADYYASDYLFPIKDNTPISVAIKAKANVKRGVLHVGIARELGKSLQPKLTVNGKEVDFPTDWKGYDQADRGRFGFFGVIEVAVPGKLIQAENRIELTFAGDGGRVSSVKLVTSTFK